MSKIIESTYNKETGESITVIVTPYGKFVGKAQLGLEDKENNLESTYIGCEIAEARAEVQSTKQELKVLNNRIQEIEHLRRLIKIKKPFKKMRKKEKAIISVVNNELEELQERKAECKAIISTLTDRVNDRIKKRIDFLKKIEDKKNKVIKEN